jgi:bacillithiol biosynthesis deacetylase BshB1
MEPSTDPLHVLAVGAHPDDVEIACGGTLARLVQQGYRVGIIDLTDGEPTPNSPGPEARLAEAQAAAEALGVHVRETLTLPNRRLFDCFEARVALAIQLRRYRPEIVIGFGGKTPLASPDHWQAMQITDAAIFYSRLTKWEHHFEGLPVHTVRRHLYFRLAFEPEPEDSNSSRLTVDISQTLEQKMRSVQCYSSQFLHRPQVLDRIRAIAIAHGQPCGFAAGEPFVSVRPLGSTDLVRTLSD